MNNETTAQQIEAVLFSSGKPLSRAELAGALGVGLDAIAAGLLLLAGRVSAGMVVVDDGHYLELRTSPEVAGLLEKLRKEEYAREVGRAGQETLAAILYKGPLSRSDIDFIRGVNSSQILRTLTMRGLVRKVENPKDGRAFLYEPTTELLSTLGVVHLSDLPDYASVREKLSALEAEYKDAAH